MRCAVRVLAWLVLAVVLLWGSTASARPVIPPEREEDVQALLLPHRLGDEVSPGWQLQSIAIDLATIRVRIVDADGRYAELTLDHPDYAPPRSQASKSFALTIVAQPIGSEPAIASIVSAIEHNDTGEFWAAHGTTAVDGEPDARFAGGFTGWMRDGLVLFAILLGITAALLVHALRSAPRWIAWTLLGVTIVGALLRLTLAPVTTLEPWSYTRFMVVARRIYEGPATAFLHPDPLYMTETITSTVLVAAVLAPLAVFLMVRYTLASDRAAIVCAAIVAVLPLHIRFSHSDVSSIPSLTISALMFAIAQAAAREPNQRWLAAMLVLLPLPLVCAFMLRPPNILYAPLLLGLLFVPEGIVAKKRIVAITVVVGAVTLGFGIPHVLANFDTQVREGLSLATLSSARKVLFSFEYDTLLNPRFTPPGLTALAIVGAIDLVRRRRYRLVAALVGWLLASLVTHAYVVPKSPFMQARYHLHLVLPFVCLAACGIEAAFERRRPWLVALVLVYLAASPAIHLRFIRDVDFDDQREWAFVHRLRTTIPAGCTIVEVTGEGAGARFARVGAHVIEGMPQRTWPIVALDDLDAPNVPAMIRELPECAYFYEGMPCSSTAPTCAAVHDAATLHEVARIEFASRPYDEHVARDREEGDPVALRLYRIR